MGNAFIGTSGWNYRHWTGVFYPEDLPAKEHFAFYRKHFRTVELNSSFYRLPSKQTFANWHEAVSDDFVFAVKASRYITHMKKLKDPEESLGLFLDHAGALGKNLGPVLFQLPPGWNVNAERLEAFMQALPPKFRYAFEFRNATWYTESIYTLLKKYNGAFCLYDLAGHRSPTEVTTDFVYIRLHGPGDKYQGSYSKDALKKWATRCKSWLAGGKDVFVYFDNDQAAYAVSNALSLRRLLGQV